jgi:hypothetical protein
VQPECPSYIDKDFAPFTTGNTLDRINSAKSSTAVGPDCLTVIHLNLLGHRGLEYLTNLFNLSVSCADLPAMWKAAVIVPVLKPGKPANAGNSYRPIFLLCPAAKVLERLLLPGIVAALPKSETKHGFAPLHSCVTALLPIATQVAIGFNRNKPASRSAMCAVDISKAFDAIDHTLLIEKIADSDLHLNLVHWLKAYLSGCKAWCIYGTATFREFILRTASRRGPSCPLAFQLFCV